MYTSPDEARSDLFLSAAVYLIGPVLVQAVLRVLPLTRIPVLGEVLFIALPLVTTVLVPWLLIRYRKETLGDYGLDGSWPAFGQGALSAVPIVAAALLAAVLAGSGPLGGVPLFDAFIGGDYLNFLAGVVRTLGLVALAVYCTVKARDAFRSDPQYLPAAVWQVGRILAVISAVATALLALYYLANRDAILGRVVIVALPLGIAAAAYLVYRGARRTQLTSRAVLLTPAVLLALGAFGLFGGAMTLVVGVWQASLLAGVGLLVAMLLESRRSAMAPLGLAVTLALFSYLGS